MKNACWKYELTVCQPAALAFAEALAPLSDAVSLLDIISANTWRVVAYSVSKPDEAALATTVARIALTAGVPPPASVLERLPSVDWLAENIRSFSPFRVGRFFIHDSQHRWPVPPGAVGIEIDAATAFGTGLHPSTRGCLMALDRLARGRGWRRGAILDLGCGSGILGIAAAKCLRVAVLAADIDQEAVRVTRYNARRNGAWGSVRAVRSDSMHAGIIAARGPYALVLVNILARTQVHMAPALARHLAPDATLVLSGLLEAHESYVLAVYAQFGLVLTSRTRDAGWSTLTLRRTAYRSGSRGRRIGITRDRRLKMVWNSLLLRVMPNKRSIKPFKLPRFTSSRTILATLAPESQPHSKPSKFRLHGRSCPPTGQLLAFSHVR